MAEFLRAKEPFSFTSRATKLPRVIPAGEILSSDDPDVKGKEHLFEPVADAVQRATAMRGKATETASAAPGERRTTTRPPAKAAAKVAGPKAEPKGDS